MFFSRKMLGASVPLPMLGLLAAAWMVVGGCNSGSGSGPDLQEPFYMEMNGERINPKLKPGTAFVDRHEDEWNVYRRFGIRFPAGRQMGMLYPGVQIDFDPEEIEPGDWIGYEGEIGGIIRVSYRPDHGHRMNEARILTFTALEGDTGSVQFDEFDPSPGGRISGRLVGALLHGRFEDVQDGEFIDPDEPMELLLRNFEFDCRMPEYN